MIVETIVFAVVMAASAPALWETWRAAAYIGTEGGNRA